MVHFDFVVTDEEAETIFDCMNLEIEKCDDEVDVMSKEEAAPNIQWFSDRKGFIDKLKEKMSNYVVEERAVG